MYVLLAMSAIRQGKQNILLRIAAARLEKEGLVKRDSFLSFVRPENLTLISWQKDTYAQSIRQNVLDAYPISRVMANFALWLREDDTLFCWDDRTQRTFWKIFRKYVKHPKEIRTIRDGILSKVNGDRYRDMNPITLCGAKGIEIAGSCRDAETLLKAVTALCRKAGGNLEKLAAIEKCVVPETAVEEVKLKPQPLLVYSKTSHRKTVHRPGCSRLRRVAGEKLACFPDMLNARSAGYHPCSCCSPIRKMYRKEEPKLISYAKPHELAINYHEDVVYIQSRFDFWRIDYDDAAKRIRLMHKSTRSDRRKHDPTMDPAFHEQKCEATTLRGTLKTIVEHDSFREQQNRREAAQKKKPKAAKEIKKKERRRKICRTISMIDEMRTSGKIR